MLENAVAIIVVNWNNAEDTLACINSIKDLDYKDCKTFIVDNGSTDNSVELLQKEIDRLEDNTELIISKENLGFSGGNNLAIKQAMSEGYQLFWLINNDTEFPKDSLTNLVQGLINNQDAGMVGSKIYYYGTKSIWYAGGFIDPDTGKGSSIGRDEEDCGQYNDVKETDYITGCSLLIKKSVIDRVGLLEDGFFLYYEDTDWSLRVRSAGWKCIYIPQSIVEHKVGRSTEGGYSAPFLSYYNLRNRYLMTKRNPQFFNKMGPWLYLTKRTMAIIYFAIKRRDRVLERIKYAVAGYFHGLFSVLGKHR